VSGEAFVVDGETSFDVIIVGAGVSGLCLARLWLAAETPFRSILVIDGARDDDQLRTLSFWSETESVFEPIVRHAWDALRLVHAGGSFDVPLGQTKYRTLFWADLQRSVLEEVRAAPRCRVIEGRAQAVEEASDHALVALSSGARYRARWVMDSRFRLSELDVDARRFHPLRQWFTGWLLRAEEGTFDPSRATMFDFRTGLAEGRAFFYVLPFSRSEALCELVTLDRVDAAPVLERYVRDVLGVQRYEIVAREHGASPMTEQPFPYRKGERVRLLGIAAGRLKPSTGYALTRIEDDCRAIVSSLVSRGDPMVAPRARFLYQLMDGVLLEIWQRRPELVPGIFRTLFSKNPGDRVLMFLDERVGLLEILRLIWTLPPLPFIAAMFSWLGRRFLGIGRPPGSGP